MKDKEYEYFKEEKISKETFEYIRKCHEDLWDFVRIAFPWAEGKLDWYRDNAKIHLKYLLEAQAQAKKREKE